jgi:hypothetical protein
MARGTTKHWSVGKRVEIPAYCDLWMQGARTGTVTRFIEGKGDYLCANDARASNLLVVRMDNTRVKRLARVVFDDCKFL